MCETCNPEYIKDLEAKPDRKAANAYGRQVSAEMEESLRKQYEKMHNKEAESETKVAVSGICYLTGLNCC